MHKKRPCESRPRTSPGRESRRKPLASQLNNAAARAAKAQTLRLREPLRYITSYPEELCSSPGLPCDILFLMTSSGRPCCASRAPAERRAGERATKRCVAYLLGALRPAAKPVAGCRLQRLHQRPASRHCAGGVGNPASCNAPRAVFGGAPASLVRTARYRTQQLSHMWGFPSPGMMQSAVWKQINSVFRSQQGFTQHSHEKSGSWPGSLQRKIC